MEVVGVCKEIRSNEKNQTENEEPRSDYGKLKVC